MAGALDIVLDGAPYGPNVEEAKVRPSPPPPALTSLMTHVVIGAPEHEFTDFVNDLRQHESSRDSGNPQVFNARFARYPNEVPVQGHGDA